MRSSRRAASSIVGMPSLAALSVLPLPYFAARNEGGGGFRDTTRDGGAEGRSWSSAASSTMLRECHSDDITFCRRVAVLQCFRRLVLCRDLSTRRAF